MKGDPTYQRIIRICRAAERDMARINEGKKPVKVKYA